MSPEEPVLQVEGLTVEFATASGWQAVVEDVSFDVGPGEVGVVARGDATASEGCEPREGEVDHVSRPRTPDA